MSVLLKSDVPDVAPRARQEYEYEEPDGAPVAEQSKATSADPSYTESGSVHATLSDPRFNTVTVISAYASSALSELTVNRYSCVVVEATSSGTRNVGDATSTALSSAVSCVSPRAVQEYEYEEPDGAPVAEQSKATSADPSYTEPGSVHATLSDPRFNTVTVISAYASSALSELTVKKVFVRLVFIHFVGDVEHRGRDVHAAQERRILRIAPYCPGVRVRGTRWSPRSRTVEGNVRRPLVHRAGVRTRHAQRPALQHRHRNFCIRVFRIV